MKDGAVLFSSTARWIFIFTLGISKSVSISREPTLNICITLAKVNNECKIRKPKSGPDGRPYARSHKIQSGIIIVPVGCWAGVGVVISD